MEFSVHGKKYAQILATNFSPFFDWHCYGQVASIFTLVSDYFVKLLILKGLRSIETRKLHVRTVVPKLQSLILRVTRRVVQSKHSVVPKVPNSPQNPKTIWSTILLKSAPKPDITSKRKLCYQEIPGFYALRQHRITQHGMQIGSGTRDVSLEHIVGDVEDQMLREELRSNQHFLVDSEHERRRHKVFNHAVETLNETIVNENLDLFFKKLKGAAKMNLAFGFILKNIGDGRSRYFYAHENNTRLDRCKVVCTHDDLAKLKDFLNKIYDVIESCSRERMNTKWRFYKLTNLTVFSALLKAVLMGCKNAVLPEPLLRNATTNCLTFEENTTQPYNDNLCPFRALALQLHGTQRLEQETSKLFILFINKLDGLNPNQFQGVHMNDIPTIEDLLTINIVMYDIDFVDGNIIGELARRSVHIFENNVRLLRYNIIKCYVNNINAVLQIFRPPNCDTFFNSSIQFGATFNYMQWTSEKCLSEERISNPKNTVWQAGLFRNWTH